MVRLAIIQKQIPHYRVAFFTELQLQALKAGLEITVYCAEAPDSRVLGNFRYKILPIRYVGGSQMGPYWLKGLTQEIEGSDVIIAPLELQCLNIPYLWAIRRWIYKSWIWWGHGYRSKTRWRTDRWFLLKEAIKGFMVPRSEGLITYTEGSAEYWRKRGLPKDRVVPFFNTLDVEELRKTVDLPVKERLLKIKSHLGLDGKRVLLFSGRLSRSKRVDFLLRAFAFLKRDHPDAALLILGDGSERDYLERLASEMKLESVYFLGEKVESEEANVYFLMSELLVIPGAVGLAIVHGFTFGLPLVTTRHEFHGPEIEYLSEQNGMMSDNDEEAYAKEIGALLSSPTRLLSMQQKARSQADQLLLPHSVERFINGIRLFARIG